MTEQELREKIKNIILEKVKAEPLDASMAIEIADALIEAGIGDVSEWKNKATAAELVAQAAANTAIETIEEYKHSAEVAERALNFLCNSIMKDYDILVFKDGAKIKNKIELYTYCVKQGKIIGIYFNYYSPANPIWIKVQYDIPMIVKNTETEVWENMVFYNRKDAESRLAELKGEKE